MEVTCAFPFADANAPFSLAHTHVLVLSLSSLLCSLFLLNGWKGACNMGEDTACHVFWQPVNTEAGWPWRRHQQTLGTLGCGLCGWEEEDSPTIPVVWASVGTKKTQ